MAGVEYPEAAEPDAYVGNDDGVGGELLLGCEGGKEVVDDAVDAFGEGAIPSMPGAWERVERLVVHDVCP